MFLIMKLMGFLLGGVLFGLTGFIGPVLTAENKSKPSTVNCLDCSESVEMGQAQEYPCLQVIEVPVGGTLPMRLVSQGSLLAIGDEISPLYGDYVSGVYHAPEELTPGGLDTLTLSRANGVPFAKVVIQLIPNGGFVPEYRVVSPISTEAMTEEELAVWENSYDTSTSAYEIVQPTEESVISVGQIAGLSGQLAPMMKIDPDGPEEFGSTDALVLDSSTVKKGKKCGVFPKPKGSCTNGTVKEVTGKWKAHKKGPPMAITGQLSAGSWSIPVSYFKMVVWKVRYTDHYRCVNGQWKFVKTEKCTISGAYAWAFDPTNTPGSLNGSNLVRVILGYDINGYKFDNSVDCQTEP